MLLLVVVITNDRRYANIKWIILRISASPNLTRLTIKPDMLPLLTGLGGICQPYIAVNLNYFENKHLRFVVEAQYRNSDSALQYIASTQQIGKKHSFSYIGWGQILIFGVSYIYISLIKFARLTLSG